MDALPDEILLHILSYLEAADVVTLQQVSRQFLNVARDKTLWKQLCFEHSVTETRRRRQLLFSSMEPRLVQLVQALSSITSRPTNGHVSDMSDTETQVEVNEAQTNCAFLASWDPTCPGEDVNFYQDFIQRHASLTVSWFERARYGRSDDNLHHTATGMGIFFDDRGVANKLVAPLEDGSIGIWDAFGSTGRQGNIIARSAVGLLTNKGPELDYKTRVNQSQSIMTETDAVECVSIDNQQKKGFFAVQNVLNEVDLQTLQIVSRTSYPFPITALSEAAHPTPLTVGTNWTLHLHDTRKPPSFPSSITHCELISGNPTNSLQTGDFGGHASLSQPGPLSILHLPTTREWGGNGDIWVGGRFTSFLNYDRRFFPRLRGTVHSGAKLSCLTALPHPFIPLDVRLTKPYPPPGLLREVKSVSGCTIIAAGEYKGKGSLELYSVAKDPSRSISCSHSSRMDQNTFYQNRQTASSSKLLSVVPHGTRLVFSDGDGNLKWVERDGFTPVRQCNINNIASSNQREQLEQGDIVRKISPTINPSLLDRSYANIPLGMDNLLVWTGDGRLGMVGFGKEPVFKAQEMDEIALEAREKKTMEKERQYGAEMRRALERQAMELRWMRGYGL
ncbi:hypothetical protein GQ43DRAFT_467585 [Delitschia confertaspora ATCC 74209]|uniref:F-box domain-containing protein n=1 Tax=Delitschia confertaspora ATCC 74209 TaxID=1513339 RepID=A0A9P4N091_9PLEO|nr:hypothetical protein GQ43DRAFT_467585 [Delitschia confertaspora ATCC 74209]